MNPYRFCQTQIDKWTEISRRASENADIDLFERAEEEIANYREMQKRYAPANGNASDGIPAKTNP